MQLHLVDISPDMTDAWTHAFQDLPRVHITNGSILDFADDTIVSPANSYGEMGGGVDLVYRNFFGRKIEAALQDAIKGSHGSYLPIGEALLIPTDHEKIPRLIASPTMFLPEPTSQLNVYKASLAAFKLALSRKIDRLFCPGFGTGVGRVSFHDSAYAMRGAYTDATDDA